MDSYIQDGINCVKDFLLRRRKSGRSATVLWDIENCAVPKNMKAEDIVQGLKKYLHRQFNVNHCDIVIASSMRNVSIDNHVQLIRSNVRIKYTDASRRQSADMSLIVEVMNIMLNKPDVNHLFVFITGDRDFRDILVSIEDTYDTLLIYSNKAVPALKYAARFIISWNDLTTMIRYDRFAE